MRGFCNIVGIHIAGLLFVIALTGCSTLNLEGNNFTLSILSEALEGPLDQVEKRASMGEANAQYAMGFIYQYGLHGVTKSKMKSNNYKRVANLPKGYRTVSRSYKTGDGVSRTMLVKEPIYKISFIIVKLNERCAEALASGKRDKVSISKCNGEDSFATLKHLWNRAVI
jgi:hypothetical protein